VIYSFKPNISKSADRKERLKFVAVQVMDFLMENPQISRISMLGDMTKPKAMDNTMGTVYGFAGSIADGKPTENGIKDAFMLTVILQESFLRKDVLKMSLGVDFYNKTERDGYINRVVDKVIGSGE